MYYTRLSVWGPSVQVAVLFDKVVATILLAVLIVILALDMTLLRLILREKEKKLNAM